MRNCSIWYLCGPSLRRSAAIRLSFHGLIIGNRSMSAFGVAAADAAVFWIAPFGAVEAPGPVVADGSVFTAGAGLVALEVAVVVVYLHPASLSHHVLVCHP
jgi:hypothetical protein